MTVETIIEEIRALSDEERTRLINTIIEAYVGVPVQPNAEKRRSLRELRGLGKEIWAGVDAQAYVNSLRDEWDTRP